MRRRAWIGALAALGLSLPGFAGAELPAELADAEGSVFWVDFWASWCTPCRRSFPWMNRMHQRYADDGLTVIGVNVDKDRALAEDFLGETPAEFALRFDPDGSLAETFGVQAMPSSFLLDASGTLLATHYGFRLDDTDEYERAIRDALATAANR